MHYVDHTGWEWVNEAEYTYRIAHRCRGLVRGMRHYLQIEHAAAEGSEQLYDVTHAPAEYGQLTEAPLAPWQTALRRRPAYPGLRVGELVTTTQESAEEAMADLRDLGYL